MEDNEKKIQKAMEYITTCLDLKGGDEVIENWDGATGRLLMADLFEILRDRTKYQNSKEEMIAIREMIKNNGYTN